MALKPFQRNEQAINQERARDKKEAAEQAESGVPSYFIKKGKVALRVLPSFNERGVWFREIQEHTIEVAPRKWQSFTCPRPHGKQCPFCDEGTALYEEATEESLKRAKDLRPRTQFLFNVIVLSDGRGTNASKGVQVLKAGVMVKRALIDLDTDAPGGWGDITSLEAGHDINIERTGEGLDTTYTVKGFPKRTNIIENIQAQGVDVSSLVLHDLDVLFPPRSYEELSGVLEGQATARGFPVQVVTPGPAAPVEAPQPVPVTTTTGPQPVVAAQPVVPQPVAPPEIPAPPTETE